MKPYNPLEEDGKEGKHTHPNKPVTSGEWRQGHAEIHATNEREYFDTEKLRTHLMEKHPWIKIITIFKTSPKQP